MIHELKCTEEYFRAQIEKEKKFEVRNNDRDYKVGDYLALNEIKESGEYSGRSILTKVTYAVDDPKLCKEGYIVMGTRICMVAQSENARMIAILDRTQ